MTTIRTPKVSDRRGFSMPRSTAQDGKRDGGLSFEARGVLAYLLSKPDDWKVQISDIMADGGIGRDKAKKILSELRKRGYLKTEMVSENGRFTGKIDRVFEVSQEVAITEKPKYRDTEKPSDGNTAVRKIHPIHNREKKQNTDKRVAPAKADAAPLPELTPEQLFDLAANGYQSRPVSNDVAKALVMPTNSKPDKPARAFPHFDAIVEAFGVDPATLTKTENGGIAKVANELKAAGYTPDDILEIHAYCIRQNFTGFTWHALTAHASKWRATLNSAPLISANGTPRRPLDKFLGGMDDTYWDTYTGPEPSHHD